MIGQIEKANGVQTQFKCFRLVFQAVCLCSNRVWVFQDGQTGLCPLSILLVEGSLCLMFAKHTFARAVFELGQEEQPLSKCVLPNSLLRCVPITNRADKKSTPIKVNLDTHVFQAHKARGESGRSNAKSELWATWGSVSRNVTAAKALWGGIARY